MNPIVVRMGVAGNGVPVFTIGSKLTELQRPFGATFDDSRHMWMYPAYLPSVKKVLADFDVLKKTLPLEYSPTVIEYIKQVETTEEKYQQNALPEGFGFVTSPFQHQIQGLAHAFYFLRSALFFAPGLGKSKIAVDLLRLLHFQKEKEMAIVMGPVVTVKNWGKEIDRHSGKTLRWGAVLGTKPKKLEVIERAKGGEFDVLLITYDTVRNYVDKLLELVYKTIVADESHLIKEWSSSRTKAAHEVGQRAVRKLLMTGTPTLGSPLDLYGQFKFLGDYFMPEGYTAFKLKFLATPQPNSHVVTGFKNMNLLNSRTQFLALRKTKEECLDLPPQTFVDVDYDLSRHQTVIYNQLISEMAIDVEMILAHLGGSTKDNIPPETTLPHAAALLNKLLQISSGFLIKNNQDTKLCDNAEVGGCRYLKECVREDIKPYTKRCQVAPVGIPNTVTRFEENPKLEALEELLDSILADATNKVIVWAYYSEELNIIEEKLTELGVSYVRVDGSTGSRIQPLVDRFNDDPSVRVYLAQVSTGVGITLNASQYMIYYSLTSSLGAYLQSLDRNYRIGQTKNVTVYRLLGKQTVEPALARLLDNKVDVDQVLTHKLSCLMCPQSLKCIAEGIELFDAGCIYPKSMSRPVAKARLIKYGD